MFFGIYGGLLTILSTPSCRHADCMSGMSAITIPFHKRAYASWKSGSSLLYSPWSTKTTWGLPLFSGCSRSRTFASCGSQWTNPVSKIWALKTDEMSLATSLRCDVESWDHAYKSFRNLMLTSNTHRLQMPALSMRSKSVARKPSSNSIVSTRSLVRSQYTDGTTQSNPDWLRCAAAASAFFPSFRKFNSFGSFAIKTLVNEKGNRLMKWRHQHPYLRGQLLTNPSEIKVIK